MVADFINSTLSTRRPAASVLLKEKITSRSPAVGVNS